VQLALLACGIVCPRDTDMQEQAIGAALRYANDPAQLRRGDLLFWKGHVAIVRDDAAILHASATHMAVVFEGIAPAIARIRSQGYELTSVRRLPARS
jgi:cell wall-associated NlpC family hydrolase